MNDLLTTVLEAFKVKFIAGASIVAAMGFIYIVHHYKPEVFRMREKLVTWIILATLLMIFSIGCGFNTAQQNNEDLKKIDKPNPAQLKERGGVTP